MRPLYDYDYTSLTPAAIIRRFDATYEALHGCKPECAHARGNWFIVNGVRRDRRWLLLEIEYLRQTLITSAVDRMTTYSGDRQNAVSQVLRVLAKVG